MCVCVCECESERGGRGQQGISILFWMRIFFFRQTLPRTHTHRSTYVHQSRSSTPYMINTSTSSISPPEIRKEKYTIFSIVCVSFDFNFYIKYDSMILIFDSFVSTSSTPAIRLTLRHTAFICSINCNHFCIYCCSMSYRLACISQCRTVSAGKFVAQQHAMTYKMPKKKFNLAVCLGTPCNVLSLRNDFSMRNAFGNVTSGNKNHNEYLTLRTTNIMYGANNNRA